MGVAGVRTLELFSAFDDMDLVVTFTAVFVAGLAAVLGIWMERDPKKPPRYAWALSALILLATFVSLMQSFLDKTEQDQIKDDMARLLTTMDRLASDSDDPALLELVKAELNAQSRTHPGVVERVAQRVSDEGRDAAEVLGKHLDAAEIENVTRKGAIKAKGTDKVVRTEATEATEAPEAPGVEGRARPARARADAGSADAPAGATVETAAAPSRPGAPSGEPPARAARAPIPAPTAEATPSEATAPVPATVETAPAPGKPQPRASRAARPGTPRAPGTKRTDARPRGR